MRRSGLSHLFLSFVVCLFLGCGTTSYRRISHSYIEPPRLVLPGDLQTYALVLVDGPTRTGLAESLPIPGLLQVVDDRDADLICRMSVDQPTHSNIVIENKNRKRGVNPETGKEYAPLWGGTWVNSTEWSYDLYDAIRRQVLFGNSESISGDFSSSRLSSSRERAMGDAANEAAASLEDTYSAAYQDALVHLRDDVANGLVSQRRFIELNVAQHSEIEPRFSEAFSYLITGDESDIRHAISIYDSIGSNLVNPENGKYASHENYSSLYGKAAGYFMLSDWSGAMQWSLAAMNIRDDKNASALYDCAETMQQLTSRPPAL